MPTLDFKGKSFVYAHHLSVTFRELVIEPKKSLPPKGQKPSLDDNLIIQGDNLHALKALLPVYAGKVDCIFIDPPYNTGTEGWCYNDNVRSPLMREWLKKASPVDKEDLERHDKWLCMMWPRLKLLHELLAEDGAVFITIDDNEAPRLRCMMDEIFGAENFIDCVIWQKNYSPKNTAQHFSSDHDYILVFAKRKELWRPYLLQRAEKQDAAYKNLDNDPRGRWKTSDLSARNYYNEGTYSIKCPSGRVIPRPPEGNYWRVSEKKFWALDEDKRIWWGRDGGSIPQIKRFLSEVKQGRVPQTLWFYDDVGHTDEAKKELKVILDYKTSEDVFITPKPVRLLQRILEIATDENSLVLDSFAGSASTAHAVLAQNRKDAGNRKFVLVEAERYADTLTAERIRRAIQGYKFEGTNVRRGLEEEGMGDLAASVRAVGKGAAAASRRETLRRRKEFQGLKIFLPRVLSRHYATGEWRQFEYDRDLLNRLDWATFSYTNRATFTPDDKDALERTLVRVSVEDLGAVDDEDLSKPETTLEEVEPELDFPALVRLLLDVIPNPWQGARILQETLSVLRKRGIHEQRIFTNRLFLVKAMRDNLKKQVNLAAETEFRRMLSANEITFRLEASNDPELNWGLAETLELDITDDDKVLLRKNGESLEKSLFHPVYQKQVNGLEKEMAWYLDADKAVRWWHRIAARQDWHLQGWQRSRVYPDFLACLHDTGDGRLNFTVLETKGLHLKGNDDTNYKARLFELLTQHSQTALSVGELKLGLQQQHLRFELMLENDWREKLPPCLLP